MAPGGSRRGRGRGKGTVPATNEPSNQRSGEFSNQSDANAASQGPDQKRNMHVECANWWSGMMVLGVTGAPSGSIH